MARRQKKPLVSPSSPQSEELASSPASWLAVMVLLGPALLAGLRPVSSDALWWDLARGRAVVEGSFAPSRDLLTLDEATEADWLSGVPTYLLYAFLGSIALMTCRVLIACTFVFGLRSRAADRPLPQVLLIAACGLVLCEASFDIGPGFFDLLAVSSACVFGTAVITQKRPWKNALAVLVATSVAANFAPRVAIALLVLLLAVGRQLVGDKCRSFRSAAVIVVAALLGSCATPRGPFSIVDSVLLSCPWLAADSWALQETLWRPLALSSWDGPQMVFVGVSLFFVAVSFDARQPLDLVSCTVMQFVAWTSRDNLPIAGAWLVFSLVQILAAGAARSTRPWKASTVMRSMTVAAACFIALLAFPPRQAGWGIDTRLDYRIVQLSLQDRSGQFHAGLTGSAFCDSVRSAGMLSWLRPGSIRAQGTPQRALLQGRLEDHLLLLEDLRQQRKHSYWRTDETRGGWWLPLVDRETTLLLIAAEDVGAIRGLEPGIWKPLALDAPVLPFGQAGDPAMTPGILSVLGQRTAVETGRWVYSSPVTTGSHFDRDRLGLKHRVGTAEMALRQAAVFRAMGLYRAAAKTLSAGISWWRDDSLRTEFARTQRELAHRERLVAGRPSLFRRIALQHALELAGENVAASEELAPAEDAGPAIDRAATAYVHGRTAAAIQQLTMDSPQALYAGACLSLELGRPESALAHLQRMDSPVEQLPIYRLATKLREEITR